MSRTQDTEGQVPDSGHTCLRDTMDPGSSSIRTGGGLWAEQGTKGRWGSWGVKGVAVGLDARSELQCPLCTWLRVILANSWPSEPLSSRWEPNVNELQTIPFPGPITIRTFNWAGLVCDNSPGSMPVTWAFSTIQHS